jgi:hypothetical protein
MGRAPVDNAVLPEGLKRPEVAHVEGGPNVIALLARLAEVLSTRRPSNPWDTP